MDNLFTDSFFNKQMNKIRADLAIDDAALSQYKEIIKKRIEYVNNFNPEEGGEEKDWPGFEKHVFRDLLGYSIKDDSPSDYNISRQKKIKKAGRGGGTGKADCTLGFYPVKKSQDGNDFVIVEFKAPDTKDMKEAENQLWGYLEHHENSGWGIVTNFNEFTLYNVSKKRVKKQTFYFVVPDELKDKKHSLEKDEELIKFLSIFRKDRMLARKGKSATETMLEQQGIEEKKVEKEFYAKYYKLRIDLFNEIAKHNPRYSKKREELVAITQKILDRLIFIWFCEDSREELLPRDILQNLIGDIMERKTTFRTDSDVWNEIKKLFNFIDAGKGFEIKHGYNGELFKPDSRIDELVIPNEIFEKQIKPIGEEYDFGHENELSINILGHIFEQSITDLEELKQGKPADKKKGKRKREGVYYTPEYITRYIVEQALGGWLAERRKEIGEDDLPKLTDQVKKKGKKKGAAAKKTRLTKKVLDELRQATGNEELIETLGFLKKNFKDKEELRQALSKVPEAEPWVETIVEIANPQDIDAENWQILENFWRKYREVLKSVKVLDPASGSGAFLIQAFDYLHAEGMRVNRKMEELGLGDENLFDLDKSILENNLYGVDINDESVEITKLSLWLKTASKNKKLNSLFNNIKCGNSLIDDPRVAGKKAFKWEKEFPEIMKNGGFDVVVGNPPYVRQELLSPYKPYFEKKYKCYSGTSDLFSYFYEKSLVVLKDSGYFGFISNTFAKTTGAGSELRNYLKNNSQFISIADFSEQKIFEGITTYPIIPILKKKKTFAKFRYLKVREDDLLMLDSSIKKNSILVEQASLKDEYWSFESEDERSLKEKIKTQPTVKKIFGKCYRGLLTGLNDAFIISGKTRQSIISKNPCEKDIIKPFLEGKDLSKWSCFDADKWLIFFPKGCTSNLSGSKNQQDAWEYISNKYPEIANHLIDFEERAAKRHDKGEFWWELRACSYYNLFYSPKIVWPNLQSDNKFSFDANGFYINNPSNILPTDNKALLCLLNSKLAWFFLKDICAQRSGGYIEMKPQYFEQLPIALPDDDTLFIEKADTMLDLNGQLADQKQLLSAFLTTSLGVAKLTKKLQSPENLNFDELIKELKKKKVSTDDRNVFKSIKEYHDKISSLKSQIEQTDREIDKMVYDLYELTEDEIKIVEREI
ncbi:TaqI-like C-terminal specificity domain-containing protein [Desulfococcaceae bacterium HSG8]|nr:TaqI-like C-terminal specificity domain-containing protein [Desulfococcaceae bacterium HSG8]